jgi:hypothetical protein
MRDPSYSLQGVDRPLSRILYSAAVPYRLGDPSALYSGDHANQRKGRMSTKPNALER